MSDKQSWSKFRLARTAIVVAVLAGSVFVGLFGLSGSSTPIAEAGVTSPPMLTATALTPTFTENGAAVLLFSGADVTVEAGESLLTLVVTVENLGEPNSERLDFNGTSVQLNQRSPSIRRWQSPSSRARLVWCWHPSSAT